MESTAASWIRQERRAPLGRCARASYGVYSSEPQNSRLQLGACPSLPRGINVRLTELACSGHHTYVVRVSANHCRARRASRTPVPCVCARLVLSTVLWPPAEGGGNSPIGIELVHIRGRGLVICLTCDGRSRPRLRPSASAITRVRSLAEQEVQVIAQAAGECRGIFVGCVRCRVWGDDGVR